MNIPAPYLSSTERMLWYPVHRRWLFLFRLFGVLGAACIVFRLFSGERFSLLGCLLIYWFFSLQPEPRPRTLFYYFGIVVHWVFFALLFLSILFTLRELVHLA